MNRTQPSCRAIALAACVTAVSFTAYVPPGRAAPATQPAAPATGPAAAKESKEAKPEKPKVDENFLKAQRQQREYSKNQYNGLKDLGTFKLDGLIQLSLDQGLLQAETTAQANQQSARAKVEGSNAIWIITRQPAPVFPFGGPQPGPTITVQRFDTDAKTDDELWSTYVSANNNFLTIMGQSVMGRVIYNQNGNNINVNVMEWAGGAPGMRMNNVFNGQAASLQQLRSEHPEEFRQYVVPLLSKLSDLKWLRPGAADVYGVFAEIAADEQVKQRVADLLPQLDSPAYPVRDAASQRLDALGTAGVLAALRIDTAAMTDEQKGRLAALAAKHRRREIADPAAARKDPNFLADAMEYDDPQVRTAARIALEQLLGKPLAFDVTLSGDRLSAAVDEVRKQIAALPPATQPATQPAAKPAQ